MGVLDRLFGPPDVLKLLARRDLSRLAHALEHPVVGPQAFDALASLGGDAVTPLFFLASRQTRLRQRLPDLYRRIGSRVTAERLVALLREIVDAAKAGVLASMSRGGPALGLTGTGDLAAQHDRYVTDVRTLLACLGSDAVDPILRGVEGPFSRGDEHYLYPVLARLGSEAYDPLVVALQAERNKTSPDWMRLRAASVALGLTADLRALPILIEEARRGNESAIEGMGSLGGDQVVDALAEFSRSDRPEVREAATCALVRCRNKKAIPLLQERVDDFKNGIYEVAREALKKGRFE